MNHPIRYQRSNRRGLHLPVGSHPRKLWDFAHASNRNPTPQERICEDGGPNSDATRLRLERGLGGRKEGRTQKRVSPPLHLEDFIHSLAHWYTCTHAPHMHLRAPCAAPCITYAHPHPTRYTLHPRLHPRTSRVAPRITYAPLRVTRRTTHHISTSTRHVPRSTNTAAHNTAPAVDIPNFPPSW